MYYISELIDGNIRHSELSQDFDLTCQVLCVGAGAAGIYAASAAAHEGASVILLENDDNVGGMHGLGRVAGHYYGFPGGSFEQDEYKIKEEKFHKGTFRIDHRQVMERARLLRQGVDLRLRHTPTGVILDGSRVVGLRVFDGEGEMLIGASIVIDSTSDGHLLRMLEVEKRYGRDTDGKLAPFSVFAHYYADGKPTQVNEDAGYINQYDSEDFSQSVLRAHAAAHSLLSRGDFICLASHTGVREGLSFEGEEKLSYLDVIMRRAPERVMFYAYSDLDRHGCDNASDEESLQNFNFISNLSTVAMRIPVPFGCVVPRGVRGIVTACRCISADSHIIGAVRMNRDMFRIGECVGVAAAMAVKDGVDFLEIDYGRYVERVDALGCFRGDGREMGFDSPNKTVPYTPLTLDVEENLPLLKTERPGAAIWACYNSPDRRELSDLLCRGLSEAVDDLYRYNLAIALGIMEDKRALSTLREIVRERDCYYFKDCRRTNRLRSAIAICLLGRLGDTEDIAALEEIVFDEGEIDKALYHTLEPNYLYRRASSRNFVYFDIMTHAVASLVKIYKRTDLDTADLADRLERELVYGGILARVAPTESDKDVGRVETADFLRHQIDILREKN